MGFSGLTFSVFCGYQAEPGRRIAVERDSIGASLLLIQILLPLPGDGGSSSKLFAEVREELAARFGGLTFYRNAPTGGLWKGGGDMEEDAIVVAEVMAHELDREWWACYREKLECRFQQDEIVVRSLSAERL